MTLLTKNRVHFYVFAFKLNILSLLLFFFFFTMLLISSSMLCLNTSNHLYMRMCLVHINRLFPAHCSVLNSSVTWISLFHHKIHIILAYNVIHSCTFNRTQNKILHCACEYIDEMYFFFFCNIDID